MAKKTIPFEGNYWWGDSKNATNILEKEFKKILGATRVHSIQINGCDFNDGKENRQITITVEDNKITMNGDF